MEKNNQNTQTPAETKKKPEKMIPAKKLPGILKKAYTPKAFEKLCKKVYVPKQLEFMKSFFEENKNPKKPGTLAINPERLLVKTDFNRLKKLGKEIKKQKFGIKLAPLIAVVVSIFVVVTVVITFKNVLAKKILVSAMQSVFGAKTDVEWVNVEILGASVHVEGLQQANKDEPMKNLFEIQTTIIDFNLTQALRGKFDAENIAVEGIRIGTDRKTSGALPVKVQTKDENETSFMDQIAQKGQTALDASKDELAGLFNKYNPENLLADFQSQLKSPAIAQQAQTTTEELIKKWQDTPAQLEKQINSFSASVEQVVNTDWTKVQDPVKIKQALETVMAAIETSKELKTGVTTALNEIKTDGQKVTALSKEIAAAIKEDNDFVKGEVSKIKAFTVGDGFSLLSGPIENVLCKTLGNYYGYIQKGISLANSVKANSKPVGTEKKKAVKPKMEVRKRQTGRTIYYRADRVPKFLIEKVSVSGDGFSGKAADISSDMDIRQAPASADAQFKISNQNHKAGLLVDTRTVTDNSLISAYYSGTNYPIAIDIPQFGIKSPATIGGTGSANLDGSFTIDMNMNLTNLSFETEPFQPEFGYRIYQRALSKIRQTKVGAKIEWTSDKKLSLKLDTDLDKQLANALKLLVNEEIDVLKTQALDKAKQMLSEKTGGAAASISSFGDIQNKINLQNTNYTKLDSSLASKKKELESKLAGSAGSVLSDKLKGAASSSGSSDSKDPASALKKMLPF